MPDQTPPIATLTTIADRLLWLSAWMIHNANHLRPAGEANVKVGGHQASSASMVTIMTALYFHALGAEDRVAVKPHAAPVLHAIQYLAGQQSLEKLQNYRGFGGAQSYPSRTKDGAFVDFSTGSVGLGVAQTLFASLVQDYVAARDTGLVKGRMVALIGDAEMDEGNIYEALLEGWKHDVRNLWWVVDYNRQSLDAMVREGLWSRFQAMFQGFGWDVVVLRHGTLQMAAFAEPGGAALRNWIEGCPNAAYAALTFQGGAAWRARLMADLGDQGDVSALLDARSDDALATLMGNLGGHDLPVLTAAFDAARSHDRPTVFLCYTNKGHGLPLAGHKDNHAGLMTPAQIAVLRDRMGIAPGAEWDKWPAASAPAIALVTQAPALRPGRRKDAGMIAVPDTLPMVAARDKPMSTQMGFGLILNEIARGDSAFARAIVTTSPDVTVSTNLGPWVNRRGLFAKGAVADLFREERIPSTFNWAFSPQGQHLELGIAESNLFLMLAALGLSHSMTGRRLLPIGTVYDPFIYRGLDQLNHACYQDARFMLVATPSGVTLAPEGGAHQSIGTPLVGMAQDGLASFEPAFIDELAVILRFAFDYMQRDGDAAPDPATWLRDATGGSSYLRLSTRPLDQPLRDMTLELADNVVNGGYWLRAPGPNAELVIAYQGVVAPEAIAAVARLAGLRRDVGLLAITSADRLNAGWTAAERAREAGVQGAQSHVERLLAAVPRDAAIVTVIDGHPATLAWLGAVRGHRVRSLGVEHFGQTGTIADLYRHFGIDTAGIIRAALAVTPGRRL